MTDQKPLTPRTGSIIHGATCIPAVYLEDYQTLERALQSAEQSLSEMRRERDEAKAYSSEIDKMGGHLYCTTCGSCGEPGCCPPSMCWRKKAESAEQSLAKVEAMLTQLSNRLSTLCKSNNDLS